MNFPAKLFNLKSLPSSQTNTVPKVKKSYVILMTFNINSQTILFQGVHLVKRPYFGNTRNKLRKIDLKNVHTQFTKMHLYVTSMKRETYPMQSSLTFHTHCPRPPPLPISSPVTHTTIFLFSPWKSYKDIFPWITFVSSSHTR